MSERMYNIAVKGYVALFRDKGNGDKTKGLNEWLTKIREMLNTENKNTLDFISDFKMNLFSDEIFVFTPRGEMKSLPNGSTVLDFAYNIHTQIGDECIGAKVNHKLVPLNYQLKSGDQVEILTSKRQIPREEWFGFVKTARAKHRIKNSVRDYRKKFKEKGRKKLKEIFKQLNLDFNGTNLQRLMDKYNVNGTIDLFFSVSQDKIGLKEVRSSFSEAERGWIKYLRRPFSKGQKNLSETIREAVRDNPESVLIGGDVSEVNYETSECCNPIPGDDVVGFINENRPIQIHQTNCPNAINLMSTQAGRIVKAKWKKKESVSFLAGLKIKGIDHVGFINTITDVVSKEFKLNIRSFHLESSEGFTQGVILVYVPNSEVLNKLVDRLKKIEEIKKVSRIKRLEDSGS
jgi:GTP pyrophosphokinase